MFVSACTLLLAILHDFLVLPKECSETVDLPQFVGSSHLVRLVDSVCFDFLTRFICQWSSLVLLVSIAQSRFIASWTLPCDL